MEKMKSDVPLDYAVFQLSPKRTRCELFVSSGGSTEKLASGLLKPFIAHLKVAEEQVASAAQSVKLEVGRRKNAEVWFTKGTLERFVRFVSTPEVLELVNSSDVEMAQLEAARKIYSQGVGDQHSGGGGSGFTGADDATKMELLRAIDVRLMAVQQDLSAACARTAAAGFNADTVSELKMFADRFGAHRLNEACSKFISMCERRANLMNQWKPGPRDRFLRSSCESDMSIDDDMPSPHPTEEPVVSQQSNLPPAVTLPQHRRFSREPSVERDDGSKQNNATGEKNDTSNSKQTESIHASQPARRLSVQDRINMFENKQKECSGGKPVVAKSVELRWMSSDLSAGATAEKSVLRRWSGASDMSIDLSAEKKDGEIPSCTPSFTTVSWESKVVDLNDDTRKSSSVVKPEIRVIPSLSRDSDIRSKEGSTKSIQNSESGKFNSNLVSGESDVLKGQVLGQTQSTSDNQAKTEGKLKNLLVGKTEGVVVFGDQDKKIKVSQSGEELGVSKSQVTGNKDQGSSLPQARIVESTGGGQVYFSNQREYSESENEPVLQTSLKYKVKIRGDGVPEGSSGSRIRDSFSARYKGVEADSSIGQQEVKSVGNNEVIEKKESHAPEKVSSGSVLEVEGSAPRRMKSNRQGLGADLSKKTRVQREGSHYSWNNNRAPSSSKVTSDSLEGSDSFSTPPPEQYQTGRQSKGNQERNDELKMKANELEKLFAEHKLRVPGDQLNSAHKGQSEDRHYEPTSSLQHSKPVAFSPRVSHKSDEPTGSSKNKTKSNFTPQIKTTNSQNYADALSKNFSELSVAESSRGKLYDKYIQKRDAKLREDWSSNRAEKEARFKSMQDSLERNRSEMKSKFSGYVDRQDSVSSTRCRAERLRSFNSRSIVKREQPSLDFEDSEDDGEALELFEEYPREDRALDDISSGDGISRDCQGKKHFPNSRNLSSAPRNSAVPVPRSANRTSTNSGKRRIQQENPLAQSVPNFSDLRKENTKPSSVGSKTIRSQARNHARIKSANEEAAISKEPRRLQAIRKSSANPREIRDMPSLESDVDLTPVKFDEEVQKSVGTKPFLKKGSRASFVSQTSIPRQRVPVGSEPANKVDENDDVASGPDEPGNIVKDEAEDESKSINIEDDKSLDDGDPIPGPESDKFVNSGSENGDTTLTFSRVGQALGSQLPSEISSSFLAAVDVQDWPGESPTSWNSRGRHPFSYPHEMSDVDAFADSPVGSPASWNSQSLNQMENDAARMRKKWGMAQKPMLVAHSSNNSRKDMTRGFKRLLKFGRKSRGSESLADWISATTSEGDDDTEDGRDLANRSSEDLRKSRMGFSLAQPSDDSFNEHEVFSESVQSAESSIPAPPANFKLREDHLSGSSIKAPRSFFSLSTFRSKGSESKPR